MVAGERKEGNVIINKVVFAVLCSVFSKKVGEAGQIGYLTQE